MFVSSLFMVPIGITIFLVKNINRPLQPLICNFITYIADLIWNIDLDRNGGVPRTTLLTA